MIIVIFNVDKKMSEEHFLNFLDNLKTSGHFTCFSLYIINTSPILLWNETYEILKAETVQEDKTLNHVFVYSSIY